MDVMMQKDQAMHRRKTSSEEEKLEAIDLSGLSLVSLPGSSVNAALILKLDLSNSSLESIPESLTARLLNVLILDLHSNQLKSLPNSIGCLSKLKSLNISGNMIEALPKTIENCRLLEELIANFNNLTFLPDAMGFELSSLQKLCVNSNKLAFLPSSTSHLTSLRHLDAHLNCLRSLPDGLENLTNLRLLNVSQNFQYLRSIPYSVGLLSSLTDLDVSYNQIAALPDSIARLTNLRKLSLEGNPLAVPPPDVVEQGLEAVKRYLGERMLGSADPLSKKKKKSWILGRFSKCGTFSGTVRHSHDHDGDRRPGRRSGVDGDEEGVEGGYGFLMSDYRSIDGLASPRFMSMLSPKRLFSPKNTTWMSPLRS